jgi:hypothetical protein
MAILSEVLNVVHAATPVLVVWKVVSVKFVALEKVLTVDTGRPPPAVCVDVVVKRGLGREESVLRDAVEVLYRVVYEEAVVLD